MSTASPQRLPAVHLTTETPGGRQVLEPRPLSGLNLVWPVVCRRFVKVHCLACIKNPISGAACSSVKAGRQVVSTHRRLPPASRSPGPGSTLATCVMTPLPGASAVCSASYCLLQFPRRLRRFSPTALPRLSSSPSFAIRHRRPCRRCCCCSRGSFLPFPCLFFFPCRVVLWPACHHARPSGDNPVDPRSLPDSHRHTNTQTHKTRKHYLLTACSHRAAECPVLAGSCTASAHHGLTRACRRRQLQSVVELGGHHPQRPVRLSDQACSGATASLLQLRSQLLRSRPQCLSRSGAQGPAGTPDGHGPAHGGSW